MGVLRDVPREGWYEESVRLNVEHGRPLDAEERTAIVRRLRRLGRPVAAIATLLAMPVRDVEKITVANVARAPVSVARPVTGPMERRFAVPEVPSRSVGLQAHDADDPTPGVLDDVDEHHHAPLGSPAAVENHMTSLSRALQGVEWTKVQRWQFEAWSRRLRELLGWVEQAEQRQRRARA